MSKLWRIGVSAILLSWVGWHTDWPRVGQAFAHLRIALWLAAVGVLLAMQLVSALRWKLFARTLRFDRPLAQFTGFYFIGMYFNLVLPTSVGGDVVRAWYLDGRSGRRLAAFATVFLDRLSGLAVLLALACLAVMLSPLDLPVWMPWTIGGLGAAMIAGLAALPLLAGRFPNGSQRAQQIKSLLAIFRRPRLLLATTFLSAIVQVGNVVLVVLLGLALSVPIPGSFYWVLVPMVSLLTLLPISVNGMGIREGATVLLLAPLGVDSGLALTLAFLWFAVYVAASLCGGLVYLVGRFPKPETPAMAPDEELPDHGSIDCHSDQGRARQLKTAA